VATVAAPPEYVRICPVCEAENPPASARCACGASLAGVDFTLKRAVDDGKIGDVAPASEPAATVMPASAENAPTIVCPFPDCAQPNPPGHARCVYCNRPLATQAPASAVAGARPLPAALRDEYRVVDVFNASGSEADIMLVVDRNGDKRVVKLYRKGIEPDFRLLDVLSKTVGDSVVRVLAHGVSEGVAYEVLEYIAQGTLQQLMQAGPLTRDEIRRIVTEIADALNGIHAHRILHRDLKPENVLVRSRSPLELALTDFGIASLAQATQHFTGAARTTKYAAPEALTGVIDAKSDWWSLGMIVLEATIGRHPFDGLTEQVMSHHLATRPIDVRGVYDDTLRLLCRGLLIRDPKRRFGADQVARWLAGDPTLEAPTDSEGVASVVRPYRVGTTECTTAGELALALARHWDDARKDLARGQIARWIEHELNDYNLVRKLRDIDEQGDLSADGRLLRFLLAAAPDLPPVWQGKPVSHDAIVDAARGAATSDHAAESWLDSLFRDGVLALFAQNGQPTLREMDRLWRDGVAYFFEVWQAARAAEEAWKKEPRAIAGLESAKVVSFDDLVYGAPTRLAPPPQRTVHATVLLAQTQPDYVTALRGEITSALGDIAGRCPWFEALGEKAQRDTIAVLVAARMLPHARDDAAMESRRDAASNEARARIIGEARDALRESVNELLAIGVDDDGDLDQETTKRLLDALSQLQLRCRTAVALPYAHPDVDALRRTAERLAALALSAQQALARCEESHGINAIFMRPERLIIVALIGIGILATRNAWLMAIAFVAALAVFGYRWYAGFQATDEALAQLRAVRLGARTFLRSGTAAATS
jgi:serine/threonine protein kinase